MNTEGVLRRLADSNVLPGEITVEKQRIKWTYESRSCGRQHVAVAAKWTLEDVKPDGWSLSPIKNGENMVSIEVEQI